MYLFGKPFEKSVISVFLLKYIAALSYSLLILPLILTFIIGYCKHASFLYDYKWNCRNVYLPSVSRVINLPIERIVFQVAILSCTPIRMLIVWNNCNQTYKQYLLIKPYFPIFCRLVMVTHGCLSQLFLVLLSLVGERESGAAHVFFFILFAIFTYTYIITHWVTMKRMDRDPERSLHYLRRNIVIFLTIIGFMLFLTFILYDFYCIPFGYETFALCEYLTIIGMITYSCLEFNEMGGLIMIIQPNVLIGNIRV